LSMAPEAFVRPSPSAGSLGGVARRTRECILLCEAAGYDVVIVETVGVGQSEISVASMVDVFVPLHMPHTGDELQGIKKGVMELADMVIVSKADGPTLTSAQLAQGDLQRAFSLVRASDEVVPNVMLVSSTEGVGILEVWNHVEALAKHRNETGNFQKRRMSQQTSWLEQEVDSYLREFLQRRGGFDAAYSMAKNEVATLCAPASIAARRLVESLIR
jgi:LAO/AO transport system kinase